MLRGLGLGGLVLAVSTVAASGREDAPPLSVRLVEAAPGGPVVGGLLLMAVHYALFLALHVVAVPLGALPLRDPWLVEQLLGPNAIMSFLVGFAPAAMALSKRAARGIVAELAPSLEDPAAAAAAVGSWPRAFLRAAGAVGVAVIVPVVLFDPGMKSSFAHMRAVDELWVASANGLSGWLVTRALAHELWLARRFSELGRRGTRVDLYAPERLVPFARRGVQSVLLWSVAASVFSLLFVGGWAAETAPQVLVLIGAVAVVTLVLPVLGVHARLRTAKAAELTRLRDALRAAHDAVLETPHAEAGREAAARLPALAALEARTAALREWPFDAPTLLRFAAYVALGLGSWVGAALVERGVDLAIR